eukprot:gene7057-1263_t
MLLGVRGTVVSKLVAAAAGFFMSGILQHACVYTFLCTMEIPATTGSPASVAQDWPSTGLTDQVMAALRVSTHLPTGCSTTIPPGLVPHILSPDELIWDHLNLTPPGAFPPAAGEEPPSLGTEEFAFPAGVDCAKEQPFNLFLEQGYTMTASFHSNTLDWVTWQLLLSKSSIPAVGDVCLSNFVADALQFVMFLAPVDAQHPLK